MNAATITAWTMLGMMAGRVRSGWEDRESQEGASTLELVILVLGLITVATLLVATLTAAVKSRTDQIS